MDFPQRSFSLERAVTSLYAKFNLLAHFSASAMAPFFSAMALSNSEVSLESSSLSFLTISSTSVNLTVASSSYSVASLSALRLGSTS